MDLYAVIDQVATLLQTHGRVSYRSMQLQFALNAEQLEAVKDELIAVRELAVDKDGKMLVWREVAVTNSATREVRGFASPTAPRHSAAPATYTPPHLAERIRAEQATIEARGAIDGERKTITALFADIQDSTALIEALDPEAARRLIDPALQLMMDAVHRYEGFVVQPTGDGIFALFGAPIAHEDHPQRALFAALLMQQESKRYAEQLRREQGLNLQIRVGVNTGEVVLRSIRKDDLHRDYTPVGHSTHLAARMESLARGGAVVVSEHTYKLIEGYFECQALGAAKVKGVTEPIPIYEVLGIGPLRTRLQVAARHGLVRFVGRQNELEQMQKALEHATAGHGQIVGVVGEPGVGKSRLFYEFKLLAQRGCLVLETFSVSHSKAYPYLPLIDLLKNYFHITPQNDERRRREKITGRVLTLDRSLEDTLPYLYFLLGITEPTSSLPQMDPQIRRRRTLEALKRVLVRESLNQPLILIFEDLHWLDSETQAFLSVLSDSLATAPILLLVNYRPEYRQEWGSKTFYTQLRLDPLGQEDAHELLTALLGEDPALPPLKQFILAKTEGNPFFMEEIVQALVEQGVLRRDGAGGRLRPGVSSLGQVPLPTDLRLPTTVQGVLAARIDRLPAEEKELLQTLAVIGKEFSLSLLKQGAGQSEEELQRLLSHLQAAEFIYEQPAFPEIEYTFKHALTQEVAYNSLLIERRKVLHERTAQAIEVIYHSRLEDHYEALAHHYTRSGNTRKAVESLQHTGQQAVQRSAHAEAISHLSTALELLSTLPDTLERAQQDLTLQVALALPLMVTKGFAAPEVGAVHTRALALCRQLGETPPLFRALWAARPFYLLRAELQTARELTERLLLLAQQAQDSALLLEAHLGLGSVLNPLGELVAARAHFEQALALYDPRQWRSLIARHGGDLGVGSLSLLANVLWLLGYPDQARQRSRAALTLAQEIAHPFSTATVWFTTTMFHQFLHEAPAVQQQAEAMLALCNEQGFSAPLAVAIVRRGWALAMQGQEEEGIPQIHQGLAATRASGAELFRPYHLALLAEAYGKTGQAEEGVTALAEALDLVDRTGERQCEAELYRLKGELTLQPSIQSLESRVKEAEVCFHKAIDIARRQQAKSWELRAATSLARLWQQQGKKDEARQLLAEIYGWFTEGFETKDLQEAKALVEELT
jgi:predicted ATPase/class 3 adenylate cyclase